MTEIHAKHADHMRLREQLADTARSAAQLAYAPYSNFRVGAAVLGSSGEIYKGANIENASYGLTICAERVALAAARMAKETHIEAVAVACVDAAAASPLEERMPCGACRQWIWELAPNADVLIVGTGHTFSMQDLMPRPFRLET